MLSKFCQAGGPIGFEGCRKGSFDRVPPVLFSSGRSSAVFINTVVYFESDIQTAVISSGLQLRAYGISWDSWEYYHLDIVMLCSALTQRKVTNSDLEVSSLGAK